ncbi:MAG: gamma-glutamylcyclotransferase [Phycisphaerales bacterium]|nr:gamma-glutamylcyclotransferase [Phycisphaerales bacterium]
MSGEPRLLFVYGTLRRGGGQPAAQRLHRHATFAGEAVISGRLYDEGRYPAAVPESAVGESIHGELFELHEPDHCWPWLDAYEGYRPADAAGSLFIRRLAQTRQATGVRQAWVYWYNRSTEGLARIPTGTYVTPQALRALTASASGATPPCAAEARTDRQ